MVRKWRKLSSEAVFKHPRLTLYEDEVQLPDGKTSTYIYIGDLRDGAMTIAINSDGKILLQQEYSYPVDDVLYQFPGGMLSNDEPLIAGALRELGEEAHLKGKLENIGWFYPDNRRKQNKIHVFIATELSENNLDRDPEEFIEDNWFSVDEINSLIRNRKITNHTTLAAWALFQNRA